MVMMMMMMTGTMAKLRPCNRWLGFGADHPWHIIPALRALRSAPCRGLWGLAQSRGNNVGEGQCLEA